MILSCKNNRGFTLVEILLALSILAFCAVPMYRLMRAHARLVQGGRDLETAINLAQQYAEQIRITHQSMEEYTENGRTVQVDGKQWRIQTSLNAGEDRSDPLAPVQVDILVFKQHSDSPTCKISVLKNEHLRFK